MDNQALINSKLKPIPVSLMTDFMIGQCTEAMAGTGCSVIIAPQGATGGVDVRGGAPATRETDLLRSENLVSTVHAVLLSGGSAFGLAASSGVADELECRGIGLDVGVSYVPIVVQASLFDLAVGSSLVRPHYDFGIQAVQDAFNRKLQEPDQGNVGAGTGACVGKCAGIERASKTGLGIAAFEVDGVQLGAICALNALGDVVDPYNSQILAGLRCEDNPDQFYSTERYFLEHINSQQLPLDQATQNKQEELPCMNTTIACVFTNARLNKAQANKLAQISHDAFAHCIRPCHTSNDGDTIFTLASGKLDCKFDMLGVLAQKALEAAILNAVYYAQDAYGLKSGARITEGS